MVWTEPLNTQTARKKQTDLAPSPLPRFPRIPRFLIPSLRTFALEPIGNGWDPAIGIREIRAIRGRNGSKQGAPGNGISLRKAAKARRRKKRPPRSTRSRSRHSGWTTAASSDHLFSNFFEEFPGPSEIQAVFLHLSNEQRDADLDRPTPCRHIQKRGSAPPNSRPVFSQSANLLSVVKFDMPTGSGINTVELSR